MTSARTRSVGRALTSSLNTTDRASWRTQATARLDEHTVTGVVAERVGAERGVAERVAHDLEPVEVSGTRGRHGAGTSSELLGLVERGTQRPAVVQPGQRVDEGGFAMLLLDVSQPGT